MILNRLKDGIRDRHRELECMLGRVDIISSGARREMLKKGRRGDEGNF